MHYDLPKRYKNTWLRLNWTNHAKERFYTRCSKTLGIMPNIIQTTEQNTTFLGDKVKISISQNRRRVLNFIVSLDGWVKTCYYETIPRK